MANFYCKYYETKSSSIASLTVNPVTDIQTVETLTCGREYAPAL